VMKAALADHLGVDRGHIERVVFPESRAAPVMTGLFKA